MLTAAEISRYRRDGWVGPFRALDEGSITTVRERIVAEVLGPDVDVASDRGQCRHLDNRIVFDLCALPAITNRIAQLYGPNLVLWRSHLWCKQPGDEGVAWHQDYTHWPLRPMISMSAWLALDQATSANGCLRVLSGSHRSTVPTKVLRGDPVRDTVADEYVDESRAVDVELQPGEFLLFSHRLLHTSRPNRSPYRRLGLAIRVTVPSVTVDHSRLCGGNHWNVMLRGVDNRGLNRLQDPPEEFVASRG
jgi:ectoine hydroxylase-related dioxygenase (phytanoyl-CoA dioxygenase family)